MVNSQLADIDWSHVFSSSVCIEDFTNSFHGVIYKCIDKNVPHSTSNGHTQITFTR